MKFKKNLLIVICVFGDVQSFLHCNQNQWFLQLQMDSDCVENS